MRRWLSLTLTLPLMAAAPAGDWDHLVRQGNTALANGDFAGAIQAYERAEERTTDPGLVAFNKALAHYQRSEFSQAELHFRQSLQDASGRRRGATLYNLASCLVQQAGDRDVRRLREAVQFYEACLREAVQEETLIHHARHNRELAKSLWTLARAREEQRKDNPPTQDEPPDKPPTRPDQTRSGPPETGTGQARAGGDRTPAKTDPGSDSHGVDKHPQPGKGELKGIPDQDDPVSMTQDEALRHLQAATLRVLEERSAHRQRSHKAPSGKVRDW